MFSARYWGPSYWGRRYFGRGSSTPPPRGAYWGPRYFGGAYWGARYFPGVAGTSAHPVRYHVYANDHAGGPVDYATPIADAAGLAWTIPALAYPADITFAVRAYDPATGFEELNVDCRARLVLNAIGADITNRPDPPTNVVAVPTKAAGATVHWTPAPTGARPTGWRIWATAGTSVNYAASPTVTVPYGLAMATLTGLTDGTSYAIGVRGFNALSDDANTTAVTTLIADGTGPGVVDGLAATVGP